MFKETWPLWDSFWTMLVAIKKLVSKTRKLRLTVIDKFLRSAATLRVRNIKFSLLVHEKDQQHYSCRLLACYICYCATQNILLELHGLFWRLVTICGPPEPEGFVYFSLQSYARQILPQSNLEYSWISLSLHATFQDLPPC